MKTFREFSREIIESVINETKDPIQDDLNDIKDLLSGLKLDINQQGFKKTLSDGTTFDAKWEELQRLRGQQLMNAGAVSVLNSIIKDIKEEFITENAILDLLRKKGIRKPKQQEEAIQVLLKVHDAMLELEKKKRKQGKRIAYSNNDNIKKIYSKNRRDEVIRKIQQNRSAKEKLLNPKDETPSENRKQAVGGKKR